MEATTVNSVNLAHTHTLWRAWRAGLSARMGDMCNLYRALRVVPAVTLGAPPGCSRSLPSRPLPLDAEGRSRMCGAGARDEAGQAYAGCREAGEGG